MARGVNKVILVGNLGADPDARYMPSGGAVTTISIATSEQWTDKATNQKQERTEWHRVTLFNRLGEIAAEYLKKGSQVYIEGSIRTEKYQDKQTGQDRYSTTIIARDMQLLGGAPGAGQAGGQAGGQTGGQGSSRGGGSGGSRSNEFGAGSAGQAPRPAEASGAGKPAAAAATADFDDEIPFLRSEYERIV